MNEHLLRILKSYRKIGMYERYTCDYVCREVSKPPANMGVELSKLNGEYAVAWVKLYASNRLVELDTRATRFKQYPINVLGETIQAERDGSNTPIPSTSAHPITMELRKKFVQATIYQLGYVVNGTVDNALLDFLNHYEKTYIRKDSYTCPRLTGWANNLALKQDLITVLQLRWEQLLELYVTTVLNVDVSNDTYKKWRDVPFQTLARVRLEIPLDGFIPKPKEKEHYKLSTKFRKEFLVWVRSELSV